MYVKACETVPQSGRASRLAHQSPGAIPASVLPLSTLSPPQAALLCCLSTQDFEPHETTAQASPFQLTASNMDV